MSDEEADNLLEWHLMRKREDAIDELTNVAGIGTGTAGELHDAGYMSIQDLREAEQEELAEVDVIGRALAARIKADVGDSRSESSVTASSTDEADVGDLDNEIRYVVVEMPDGQRYKYTYKTDPENHGRYGAIVSVCGKWKEDTGDSQWVEEIAQYEAEVVDEGMLGELSDEYDVYAREGENYGPDEPTPADDVHVEGGELVMEHGPGDETRVDVVSGEFVRSRDEIEPVSDETIEELKDLYPSLDLTEEERVEELGDIIKGENPYEGPLSDYVDDPGTEHAFSDARIAELVEK